VGGVNGTFSKGNKRKESRGCLGEVQPGRGPHPGAGAHGSFTWEGARWGGKIMQYYQGPIVNPGGTPDEKTPLKDPTILIIGRR